MSFFYLATPYSKYARGLWAAYEDACENAALLVKAGVPVFCPIAHTHGIADHGGIDKLDHNIWLPADKPFMDAAKGLIVCKMQGWDESHGIFEETIHFYNSRKPIHYMDPGIIPDSILKPTL